MPLVMRARLIAVWRCGRDAGWRGREPRSGEISAWPVSTACKALSTKRTMTTPETALAPLRFRGPRRVCHGRRLGRRGARRATNTRKRTRGAKIYGEVAGLWPVGRCLPHHLARRRMAMAAIARCQAALKTCGPGGRAQIDYVNAHGTSTPVGDEIELELGAVERSVG